MDSSTTSPQKTQDQSAIAAVQRINHGWIVRGNLKEHTAAYLQHLAETDPERLAKTCHCTLDLVRHHRIKMEDPKALFYSGVFAFATRQEIDAFLSDHFLTGAVASILRGKFDKFLALPPAIRPLAEKLARRIREYLAEDARSE